MAILNKDDFKNKWSGKITDNDELLVELLEDVEDSFEQVAVDTVNEFEQKYNDLMAKYKSRFLSGSENAEGDVQETKPEENSENNEGLEEVEIVEAEDIFEEVEKDGD